jgi:SWIM zinc finger
VVRHPGARTKEDTSLIDQSLAQPAHQSTTRVQRGRELYTERWNEFRFEHGFWFVPSTTVEDKFYAVRLGPVERCECPDYEHCGAKCLHIYAAAIARAKSTTCACCGNRVPWKLVTEVTEDDCLLSWFVGDRLCADCVHGGYWA